MLGWCCGALGLRCNTWVGGVFRCQSDEWCFVQWPCDFIALPWNDKVEILTFGFGGAVNALGYWYSRIGSAISPVRLTFGIRSQIWGMSGHTVLTATHLWRGRVLYFVKQLAWSSGHVISCLCMVAHTQWPGCGAPGGATATSRGP